MGIKFYFEKIEIGQISDSMNDAWGMNEKQFMADKECTFGVTNDQKEFIESTIEQFKEWFEWKHDDLVFKSIEFEPFDKFEDEVIFCATIKFELFED